MSAVLAVGFGGVTSASFATTQGSLGTSGSEPQQASALSQALSFREEFGLNTDPAYVADLEADPDASRQYGVAMTPDEIKDMDQRVAVQSDLEQLTAALQKDRGFAGLYIDQRANGAVVVQTTGDPKALQASVADMVPKSATLRVTRVAYTIDELSALQDRITSDIATWRADGVQIGQVGVDIRSNKVRVELADTKGAGAQSITDKYGARVTVVAGDRAELDGCNSRSDCGSPLKGGLSITAPGYGCTSAFVGWAQSSSKHFVVTAGHCIKDAGLSATWSHHNNPFGTGYVYDFQNGASADAGAINYTPGSGALNLAFASGTNDIRSMIGSSSNLNQPVGAVVCRSGTASGYICGSVFATNKDVNYGGIIVHHMWETDYVSGGGDSGGTMLVNTAYQGVESGHVTGHTFYTTVAWVSSATGLFPCLTAGC